MKKPLEDFIRDNREEFDPYEPGPVVWNNIQQQLNKKPRQARGILITLPMLKWSAAAAILLIAGIITYIQLGKKTPGNEVQIALHDQPLQKTATPLKEAARSDSPVLTPPSNIQPETANPDQNNQLADEQNAYNEELYHYTRLVELKQNQIKRITRDEPLLYRQFAGDISRLDSTFHALQNQLPANPNHEQILEAMIHNLQLQEALLNQQLSIIQKINHTKKAEYEKAYKSV